MRVKILLVSVAAILAFPCGGGVSQGNQIREDVTGKKSGGDASDPEFYDRSPTGQEELPLFVVDGNVGKEKLSGSEVDEETIRKAEKMADKDLLNGLNRILKNNETLEDVFRSENVYEIP